MTRRKSKRKGTLKERKALGKRIETDLADIYRTYTRVPVDGLVDVFVVWTVGTYCFKHLDTFPQLAFQGTRGSGKSRTLKVFEETCWNTYLTDSITAAGLYRLVDSDKPTLLLDEASNVASGTGIIADVFKGGYQSSGRVTRCNPSTRDVETFSTYCPKVIATTEAFDPIVADRCVTVLWHRTNDQLPRLNAKFRDRCADICARCVDFVDRLGDDLEEALDREDGQTSLRGREADLWLPLLALGRLIGGDGLGQAVDRARTRLRAIKLANERETDPYVGLLVALTEFLEDHEPVTATNGKQTSCYLSEELLAHVRAVPVPKVHTKKALTQTMRALNIVDPDGDDVRRMRIASSNGNGSGPNPQKQVYRIDTERVDRAYGLYIDGGN